MSYGEVHLESLRRMAAEEAANLLGITADQAEGEVGACWVCFVLWLFGEGTPLVGVRFKPEENKPRELGP